MLFPQQERFNAQASHLISVHQQTLGAIRPHFHVTGPSGSGKSYLIGKICDELKKHIEKLDLWREYLKLFPNTPKQSAIRWIINRMQEQSRETPIGIRLMNSTIHQFFMKDI